MQRNKLRNVDGKSIKNQSKNVFSESSESDRVSDSISITFWHHFGTILGGLGVHLPPFRLSWSLRRRFLGVCSAVLGPLGALQDLQTSILIDFGSVWSDPGAILEPFWTPRNPFRTFRPPFWSPRCPIWEAFPSLHASKPPSLRWPRRDSRSVNN